jgi:hypothetical protein
MVVAVALVAVVGVTGASAFTTATVARDAQIDIQNDDAAVIELADGNASAASTSGGELLLDFDNEGLNQDATFVFGDTTDPGASGGDAFYVENNDDLAHEFTINYTDSSAASVTLYALDPNTGNVVSGSSVTVSSVGTNQRVLVAVEISTPGTGSQTINGTLTVSAS